MKNNVKEKKHAADVFFDTVLRHPFLFITLACLLLLPLGFAQTNHITAVSVVIEALIWLIGSLALVAFGNIGGNAKTNIGLIVSFVVLIGGFSLMTGVNHRHATVLFVPVAIGLTLLGVVLYRQKKLTADRVVLLMMVLGVVARYCYCLKFSSTEMQHDIGTFTGGAGHLAYINYWYENGLTLPVFDVTTRWQFYHPPLHHMLMALLMHVFVWLDMPLEWAQEAIQILPMVYSALSMVVCYRLFKLVRLEGAGLIAAMIGVCFYPTFIIWGGAYNNDMLATFLMLLSMLWTLKWAQKPSFSRILPIALCVGCGMMSKLSAWMVAPAIAMVFIWVFVKNIKKPLPFIGQFAAFGGICAPLGLWWGIRNLMTFNIPLTYVPDTKMDVMSVAHIPAAQRLFDFSFHQFRYPFEAFTMYGAPYNEYNPMIGLLKTSLFDEYNQPWQFNEMAVAFVLLAALLAVLGFIGLLRFLLQKNTETDVMTRLFFVVIFVTVLISYYLFCFQFPHVCTENIRYCIPVIPILSLGLGFGVQQLAKSGQPIDNE